MRACVQLARMGGWGRGGQLYWMSMLYLTRLSLLLQTTCLSVSVASGGGRHGACAIIHVYNMTKEFLICIVVFARPDLYNMKQLSGRKMAVVLRCVEGVVHCGASRHPPPTHPPALAPRGLSAKLRVTAQIVPSVFLTFMYILCSSFVSRYCVGGGRGWAGLLVGHGWGRMRLKKGHFDINYRV